MNFVASIKNATKWKETRKKAGTRVRSMPAKLMLTDVLAWLTGCNKERKAVVCGTGDRKRQGRVPCCTVPVLFTSLFFCPHSPQSSWGGCSTKGVGAQSSAPINKNQTNLAAGQESATFFAKLLHNTLVI